MMRFFGRFLVLGVLFCFLFPIYLGAEEDKNAVQSVVGVDYLPHVVWSFPSLLNPHGTDEIDYDMEAVAFTSYEANVRINKLKTTLGLTAVVDDSLVGDVDRLAGYAATKNFLFRYSQGKIKGSADWTGATAPGMAQSFDYDHPVTSYEINYMFGDKGPDESGMTFGWYAGVGYTTLKVPIEIHTLITPGGKENQVYGTPVYDNGYDAKLYCAQFGFDTMLGEMAKGRIVPGTIKFFGHTQDTLGFGEGTISPESVAYAEALNPGRTFVDREGFITYVQNDSTMGVFWAPSFFKGHGVIALGYNLNFSFIATFGGAAERANELGYDASFGLLRHGPQLRVYATW
jgi:hypothetical protein